ncbi:Fic family protein [Prevotella sp. OH937_COT-195]|uniref:Fic family protein n=1 Tax=Prevotella sp. OH937_COT-195 TaxID=2491051 RepID=UPI000F651C1F|nr:Fic family protein [Prevotella sp. OH937_COT-195]
MNSFHAGDYVSQGWYNSYMPNTINRDWVINDMEIVNLLSKADRVVGRLDMFSEYVPNIDLFISMHVYKEATKSSNIEGTQTKIEEALLDEEEVPLDKRDEWAEVQNYTQAMNQAIQRLNTLPLSSRLIRETHKILMSGVRGENKFPGEFRTSQNWIGGASPADAVFVPPVFEEVPNLISDIEEFIHNPVCDLPDLIKIALIHYQFETIHPFSDGNGRVGRLLITLYLVSKGILKRPILYLSDFLESHRRSYYDKIMGVRFGDDVASWTKFFLEGVIETAAKGTDALNDIMNLQREYEEEIKGMGSRSANALKIIDTMYKNPFIDITKASLVIGQSFPTARTLIEEMASRNILQEITGSKRGKKYVLSKYINIFMK